MARCSSRCTPFYPVFTMYSTATNETQHKRFFRFPSRSSSGTSIPTWMAEPGIVLPKRHVRSMKMDSLVDEVELLYAVPQYAYVHYPDGWETIGSSKHLALKPTPMLPQVHTQPEEQSSETKDIAIQNQEEVVPSPLLSGSS